MPIGGKLKDILIEMVVRIKGKAYCLSLNHCDLLPEVKRYPYLTFAIYII
jgi:hypothetical protein